MRTQDLAAVVLDLAVALGCALGGQKVRAGCQAGCSHKDFRAYIGERQRRARCRIHDLILEFQIREPNGVGEAAGVEIDAHYMVAGNVEVVIQ